MFDQPTPFPWWLWVLAGLWTGGLALRRVRPVSRETGWFLDVLIAVYTGLLAYMAATATTGGLDAVGWLRAGWWLSGLVALAGATLCALGASPRLRNIGWVLGVGGVATLAAWLHAPELAVLCVVVGIVGALRPVILQETRGEEHLRGDLRPPARRQPEAWLVTIMATAVAVAWLGAVEYAFRVEIPRAGLSPRLTALPEPNRDALHNNSSERSELLLAGAILVCALLEARPPRTAIKDQAA